MRNILSFTSLILFFLTLSACGNDSKSSINQADLVPAETDGEFKVETEVVEEVENELSEDEIELNKNINTTVKAIIDGKKVYVSEHISYPLRRLYPLPAIQDKTELITKWDQLFDANLITMLEGHMDQPDLINRSMVDGTVGILNGLIWFNDYGGKIVSINYNSTIELEKAEQSEEKLKNAVHPILKEYVQNVLIAKCDDFIIRIDEIADGYRYAQWDAAFTMSDEPDFILRNGRFERYGTAGGWGYTFDKMDNKYIVEKINMAERDEGVGLFLTMQSEDEITGKYPLTEILDPNEAVK